MKNVLLVTDSYPPEIRSASHLMEELAEGLKDEGYNITVLTTMPQYNLASKATCQSMDVHNGVRIIRIRSFALHKAHFVFRGVAQLLLPIFFYLAARKMIPRQDIVVVYSPPLTLSVLGKWLKKLYRGSKFILNVQDIFPQNAIDLGIMKNRLAIWLFERIERAVYKSADVITAHSEGNRKFLVERKKLPKDKVKVLHNWIDLKSFEKTDCNGKKFRDGYGLGSKFVILFGGVIGPSQGLDMLIPVAEKFRNVDDMVFLLVGDGTEKSKLVEMVQHGELKNILFKPFVSKNDYSELLKEIDVGLVSLSGQNKTPVVPGKLLRYMAAGIPVIAALNRESDGHNIVKEARCGFTTNHGDVDLFVNSIINMKNDIDNRKKMGASGYCYVKKHFAKDVSIRYLKQIFEQS